MLTYIIRHNVASTFTFITFNGRKAFELVCDEKKVIMITLLIFHRYILAIIFQMQDQAAENHFSQSEEEKKSYEFLSIIQ